MHWAGRARRARMERHRIPLSGRAADRRNPLESRGNVPAGPAPAGAGDARVRNALRTLPAVEPNHRGLRHLGAYYQRKQDFPRAWRMFDAACERGGLAACWTYSGPLLRCYSMALNDGETNHISAAGLTGGYDGRCVYVERDGEPQVGKPGEHLIYIAPPGMVFESLEYTVDVEVRRRIIRRSTRMSISLPSGERPEAGKLSGKATFATAHNIIHGSLWGREALIGDMTARFKLREGRDERPVGQIHVSAGRDPTLPTRPPVGDVIATQDRKGRDHIVFNEEAGKDSNSPGTRRPSCSCPRPTTPSSGRRRGGSRSTAPDWTPHRRSCIGGTARTCWRGCPAFAARARTHLARSRRYRRASFGAVCPRPRFEGNQGQVAATPGGALGRSGRAVQRGPHAPHGRWQELARGPGGRV